MSKNDPRNDGNDAIKKMELCHFAILPQQNLKSDRATQRHGNFCKGGCSLLGMKKEQVKQKREQV